MYKFVYFDMGGVVIRDFAGTNKWEVMKKVMGVKPGFEKEFDELYDKYEREELCLDRHVDTLIPVFTEKFGMEFPPNFSMLKYFIDRFESNPSIWPIVEKVKKDQGIGLLTNMYVDMFDAIEKKGILPPVTWDVIIDSSKVGLQKPDEKIFVLAEEKSGAKEEEILFIDNTKENIDAAKEFGWQTFLYDPSDHERSCRELMKIV